MEEIFQKMIVLPEQLMGLCFYINVDEHTTM